MTCYPGTSSRQARLAVIPCERLRPFTDFVATIEQITPDRRAYVLMGAQTRVAVSVEHLRPLNMSL